MPPVLSTEEGELPNNIEDLHSWLSAELMDAGLEKVVADRLSGAGWGGLQESSALAASLRMPFSAAWNLQRQVLTQTMIKTRWKFAKLKKP